MATDNKQDSMVSAREAARLLGISTQTLASWRHTGTGPVCVRMSKRTVRYELAEIERFIRERSGP